MCLNFVERTPPVDKQESKKDGESQNKNYINSEQSQELYFS